MTYPKADEAQRLAELSLADALDLILRLHERLGDHPLTGWLIACFERRDAPPVRSELPPAPDATPDHTLDPDLRARHAQRLRDMAEVFISAARMLGRASAGPTEDGVVQLSMSRCARMIRELNLAAEFLEAGTTPPRS